MNPKSKIFACVAAWLFASAITSSAATATVTPYTGTGDWPTSQALQTVNAFSVANASGGVRNSIALEQSFTLTNNLRIETIYLAINGYEPAMDYNIRLFRMGGTGANSSSLADWLISNGSFTGIQVGSTISITSETNTTQTGNFVLRIDLSPAEQVALVAGQYFIAFTDLSANATTNNFSWLLSNNASSNYYAGGRYFDGSIKAQQSYRDYGLTLGGTIISPAPKTWAVGGGNWDINTTANWTNSVAGGGLTNYQETAGIGDFVTFDDTSSGGSPITITLSTNVSPSGLTNNSAKNYTISGSFSISGGGALTKSGNGTLTLGTANAYTGSSGLNGGITVMSVANALGTAGPISFNGGTLQWGSGVTDDITASRTVTINAGGATINVGANDVTFSSRVGNGGAGGLTKLGSGMLALNFTNQYSGDTVISNGTLALGKSSGNLTTIPNSPRIILNSGTTFDVADMGGFTLSAASSQALSGVGTVVGALTVPTGTSISAATTNTVGTLNFSQGLTVSGGTLFLNATTTGSDLLAIEGTLTVNAGSVLTILSTALTNGSYKLMQANQGFSGSLGNFTLNYSQAGKSGDLVLATDGTTNTVFLVIANVASDNIKWAGAGADWDLIGTANWLLAATPWAFTNGDFVTFDDSGLTYSSVALQAAVKPTTIIVSNTVDYTFTDGTFSGGGKISGTARLTKRGAGALNIQTVNDTTGSTTVEAGTLNVSGHLGTGPVTNNALLIFNQTSARSVSSIAGTGTVEQAGSSTLTVTGPANYTGPTIITAGTLTFGTNGPAGALSTSSINNNGTLILNSSSNWNFAMPDDGGGDLRKQASNTVTLSGISARTGETRVDSGKIILGNANQLQGSVRLEGTGTLDMNGNNQVLLNLTGGGGVITNGAGTGTNTLTLSNAVGTAFSAVIQTNAGGGGAIAVVKTGPGTVNWQANSPYAGGTEIRQGTVRIISTTPFGSGPVNMTGGAIQFEGGNMANIINLLPPVGSTTNTFFPTANLFSPAPLVGTQDLIINFGSSGSTFSMNGGAAKWGGLTNTTYLRASANGWLRFDSGSDARNVTFDLSDSFAQINANGNQSIHLGALIGNTNTAVLAPGGGSTVTIGYKNLSTTFAGRVGGSTSLIKVGTGTLTFTGTNTASGSLTVSNGILTLADDAAPTNMTSITLGSGTTLDVRALADFFVQTNELGEVTNSYYVTNATLSLGEFKTQTMTASGTILGAFSVATGSTVTVGGSGDIGTLTVSSNISLAGTLNLEIDRTNSQTSDRLTNTSGTITCGGLLHVANIGPALQLGDTFKLFPSAAVGFSSVLLPATDDNGAVYAWTNKLAIDGTIQVIGITERIYAVTPGNQLISFGSTAPGTILSSVAISGLQSSETIVGIDFRTNTLYAVGSSSRLYTINRTSGAVTAVGQFTPVLSGESFGMEVTPSGVRVLSDLDQNLLLDFATGAAAVETILTGVSPTPYVCGLAYHPGNGQYYVLDNNANTVGTVNLASGVVTATNASGIDFSRFNGFDISAGSNHTAYVASPASSSDAAANLYTVNLNTGTAALVGLIGLSGDNILVRGLAVGPDFSSAAPAIASNPTNITFSASGGALNLSWPSSHLGWILQCQTNTRAIGLRTNWVDVAGSASITATNFTVNKADPTVFYRLRKP